MTRMPAVIQVAVRWGVTVACVVLLTLASAPSAFAQEMTVTRLFDLVEKRSDKIDSLIADVIMYPAGSTASFPMRMMIQSPDKFSIDFGVGGVQVVFSGEKLWLHIPVLREVFVLDCTSAEGWAAVAFRDWINPKQMITRVTRTTLVTIFQVAMVDPKVCPATNAYVLSFVPHTGSVFKRLFGIGSYTMAFDRGNFLPTAAWEYAEDGSPRGHLDVVQYTINQPIPRECFVFQSASGTLEVPLAEVVTNKLEQGADLLGHGIDLLLQRLRKDLGERGK